VKPLQFPKQTSAATLLRLVIALALVPIPGIAADDAAGPKAGIRIIGGGQIQLQLNVGQIQVGAAAANAQAAPAKRLGQPPVIFLPGFPFHPLPNLAAGEDAKPGYLGVQLEITPDDGEAADPKEKDQEKKNAGVGIVSVMEDSPAAKAGVKEGDRVLSVEGKAAKDSTQLRELIREAKADRVVKLTIRRDGKEIDIKAKLGAFPEQAAAFQQGAAFQFAAQDKPQAVPGIVVFNRTFSPTQPSTAARTATDLDTVSLRDGNRFVGRIQRIIPEKGLLLQRESGLDLELIEEGISSLTFADREKAALPPSKVSLQMRDGSYFGGDALTMESGKIHLTLPGGHRLEFPRDHAMTATISDGQAPQIYEGPSSLAGWATRSGQGNWDYKDGLLRCITNGPIGRNFERMPDPMDLSFDVVFPPQLHHFGVSLFAAGLNQTTPGGLTVQFSPNQISANHFDGQRYNQYNVALTPDDARLVAEKAATVRYRLLVDRVNGKVLAYVNGIKRADWKLSKVKPGELGKCGAYLSITPNVFTSNISFQMGRIRILTWDGKEPVDGKEPAQPGTDQLLRSNGPPIGGIIERITEREIVFGDKSQSAPREGTVHVRFATPSAKPAAPPPAVALMRLKNGSEFTTTELTGTGASMTMTTRFGSTITLPLAALRDLEFLRRAGQPAPSTAAPNLLTLSDGTQLRGTLLKPIEGGKLSWKIAASRTPLEYPETMVAGVFFSAAKEDKNRSTLRGRDTIRLASGDWLPGDVVSLDARSLVLKTELGAELTFPLAELRHVYLSPEVTAALADGATGPDLWSNGWSPNRGTVYPSRRTSETTPRKEDIWLYHDGSYILKNASQIGSAALAKKWPAYPGPYALNFEVDNPTRTGSFNLQVFNSKDDRTFTVYTFGGRVNAYFNPSSTRLNRFGGAVKRFQVDEQAKPEGRTLRMSLVFDRPGKAFRVLMDGKEVGKIAFKADEADEALDVGGLSITPMASGVNGGRQSRIANFWMAPWAGPVAVKPATPEKQPGEEPQSSNDSAFLPTIYLANGDEFSGKLDGITADILKVNSEAGPLELPRERVAWLNFPGSAPAPPGSFPRLRFHDRGMLSIKDLRIADDRVKCKTLDGMPLEFPLSLVREVVYRAVIQK